MLRNTVLTLAAAAVLLALLAAALGALGFEREAPLVLEGDLGLPKGKSLEYFVESPVSGGARVYDVPRGKRAVLGFSVGNTWGISVQIVGIRESFYFESIRRSSRGVPGTMVTSDDPVRIAANKGDTFFLTTYRCSEQRLYSGGGDVTLRYRYLHFFEGEQEIGLPFGVACGQAPNWPRKRETGTNRLYWGDPHLLN